MGDTAYSRLRAFLRISRPVASEAFDDLDALASALRSIATIIGCPANADPLTDLDGGPAFASGPETGDAGRHAADLALTAAGYRLVGGVHPLPAEVPDAR